MRQFHIGQTMVPYEIDWSADRETINLAIDDTLTVTVTAPMEASYDDIEETLEAKQEWLLEKLYGLSEQSGPPYPKEFLSGEKLTYRGREYPLHVEESDVRQPELFFDGDTFTLSVHSYDAPSDHVSVRRKRQAVVDWYVDRAKADLQQRCNRYQSNVGATKITVDVCELSGRWGEYENGVVRLNWRLILAPVRIQDYVVIHELVHSTHSDHTDGFWNAVGSLLPDYEERREWLRVNGRTLSI
ncbi:M48 family metallopeptidase [Halovivax cerinus]|uniref:M48 family metallopeptidase n=1 Tax=Halovivax cerinus TaxID=1487865 RepID=A0ABD5NNP1_9EURY|nr:SprT family zinc-dependent metalloprotease [Halovivax cerinus]